MQLKNLSFQNLLRIMLLCWAVMQLLCYPLWHGLRDFPLVPVWGQLFKIPWYVNDVCFYAGLGLMLLLAWKPNKKLGAVLLALVLLSSLLDQNRWQPWHYQFIWMLAAYVFIKVEKQLILSWQIILVSVYFYSGFSKLQPYFIHDVWKYSILESWLGFYSNNEWIWRAGYLLPIVEMGLPLLLLTKRFRKIGVGGLIAMHVFILLWLGPSGLNINYLIWPWNIAMPLLLVGLFYHRSFTWDAYILKVHFVKFMMLLCCVMPLLGRWGYWDRYLSFHMYSGGVPQLYICTNNNTVLLQYAPFMSNRKFNFFPCDFPLPVSKWALGTMLAVPNGEERIFASIIEQWKTKHPCVEASFHLYKGGFRPTVVDFKP